MRRLRNLIRRNQAKVTVDTETLKLRIEMIDHLLKYRFTWDEIDRGLGFSKEWYEFTKKLIEKRSKNLPKN